ncbi:MAG: IS110 family transposase [Clostridiales bacterium]|jgi:transposase|nr:IS110 family transposase [Clostridiales bacterium]
MNAVGIDISKGKCMVAAMRPFGEVTLTPHEVTHSYANLEKLGYDIIGLGENTRVIMEATGRYHEPVAAVLHEMGIYVCVLNPIVIKQSGAGSVRKVKSDKKDALKIAKYGIDNWTTLRQYTPTDAVRQQLKLFSRQYNLYMKTSVALQNNLIALLDKTFPGANTLFDSPTRADGHQKWVDFITSFWHCDCICRVSQNAFTERYQKWCKRKGYNFSESKAEDVYISSAGHFPTLPKNANTKLLITSAAAELSAVREGLMTIKAEVIRLAKQLPEYDIVIGMYGVGEITGSQLMAELEDVRRFNNRKSIVAFAGIDPEVSQSGSYQRVSNPSSKRGSPHLRKTLFQVMDTYLKRSPEDEPVYQFLDKKRAEGKPYYVYMTAAANKFLRIYYARVKEHLNKHYPEQDPPEL